MTNAQRDEVRALNAAIAQATCQALVHRRQGQQALAELQLDKATRLRLRKIELMTAGTNFSNSPKEAKS